MKHNTEIECIEQALKTAYRRMPAVSPVNDGWEENVIREITSERFFASGWEADNNLIMRLAWGALAASIVIALFCGFMQVFRGNDNLSGSFEEYSYRLSGQGALEQYAGVDYEE